ncbi:MAG TPA: alpha/beta hydrolase [Terriglobales bacterium]|nr:alpha/beta hydrolase [Terriglobales bacterium]
MNGTLTGSVAFTRRKRLAVPNGVEERWAKIDGHRMRYLFAGTGPALILVHGLMGYSFSWSENLAELGRHFTVYGLDLFNCGGSERIEQDGRLETAARSIVAFMDAVNVSQAHVVGSSHGGTIVMLAAALSPERFNKIVPIAPANPWTEQDRWQARVFSTWWGRLGGYCVPYVAPVVHGYFLTRLYADRSRVMAGTVAGYNAPLKVAGTIRYLLAVMEQWTKDFNELEPRLGPLRDSPLTFLWGERDTVVRLSCKNDLQRCFPRATFKVIPDAGHLPYEERPELFNQILLESLHEA